MKKTTRNIIILFLLITIVGGIIVFAFCNQSKELQTIKSESQLMKIYDGDEELENNIFFNLATMPFSALANLGKTDIVYDVIDYDLINTRKTINSGIDVVYEASPALTTTAEGSTSRDYSTTNIQVENVDEADITKTDGNYIYSISESNVIITDVRDTANIKIAAKIAATDTNVPEDLMLYKDKLVVISGLYTTSSYYSNKSNTLVEIYDITDRTAPKLEKDYILNEPYYTSRCIDGELFVIANGYLRKENNKIDRTYIEDSVTKELPLEEIKYLKDVESRKITYIAALNLNDVKQELNMGACLIDISNAYVSENSIYLLNQKYDYNGDVPPIYSIFGPAGIFGAFSYEGDYTYNYYTEIYKFNIEKNGDLTYKSKAKAEGKTINQYSLDEKDGHLRVALYDKNGTRIVIFDDNMKEIGRTDNLAKGENMYSSRFIGNKAYLVTYKTVDPLFVIDLSNEQNPKVLGKLKIPGYSSYLHPYDENHIIGIGMETEEIVNKNSSGRVTSTRAVLKGMKMALFDVSDVENPKQISSVVIGDSRTTSAILTNPKALLFSKEKELIAIPVNNYKEDFEVEANSETYDTMINTYKNYNKDYVAEGYFVYKINVEDGIKLKGVITHDKIKQSGYTSYYKNSRLLRGLYIDENLYTVSESAVKVNRLDTLEQINELKIR